MDRQFGAVSKALQELCQTILVTILVSQKAILSVYQSIYVPTLWPQAVGSDQKNRIVDTSMQNEFPL